MMNNPDYVSTIGKIIKVVTIALVLLIVNQIYTGRLEAAITKTLEKDSELHPFGWMGGYLAFKGGTTVNLNDNGEVITGILKCDEEIRCVGGDRILIRRLPTMSLGYVKFKGGTDEAVTFNERGEVIAGRLAEPMDIRPLSGGGEIHFEDKYIAFHKNGAVATGTLRPGTYLRPVGWLNVFKITNDAGYIKFKAETVVMFNDKDEIEEGTLANDTKLRSINGENMLYKAGSVVRFNEVGDVTLIRQ